MSPLAYLKSPALRVAAAAALAVFVVGELSPIGGPLESRAYDGRLRFRRDLGWPDDLVLVAIDDATTAREGLWPWPRTKTRALVDRLTQLGAKTIAMDIIYQAPTNDADDRGLATSLSHTFIAAGFAQAGAEPRPEVLRRALLRGPIETPDSNKLADDQIAMPIDVIARGAAGVGHVALFTSPDGRVRAMRPFVAMKSTDGVLPSLPLRAFLAQRGLPESGLAATPQRLTLPDGRALPLTNGELRLDFVRDLFHEHSKAPRISAEQVMTLDPKAREAVAGKLALVFTDSSYALDRMPNPLAPDMAGGITLAYFIRTLAFGSAPRADGRTQNLFILVVLALSILLAPFAERRAPQRALGLYLAAGAVLAIVAVALVPIADVFLPVVVPVLGPAVIGVAVSIARSRAIEDDRQRLRALLRSVPALSEASEIPLGERGTIAPAQIGADRPTNATSPTATKGVQELLGGHRLDQPVQLGRYLVTRRIGRGGMGAIFFAVDQDLERAVAIKVLEAADPAAYQRFRREALAVARVTHPNVVQIHEIGFDAEVPFIVMEYVPGGTLSDAVRDSTMHALEWKRASRVIAGVARGLGAAHARGIVHRDVKPANVLLTDPNGDFAKIADFGIAKLGAGERLTREGSFVGTVGYLAPEQAAGREVDARSDVFSLGITWFRILTGRSAFDGSTAEVLQATASRAIPDPREFAPNVPPDVAMVLAAMTAIDPRERPRDGNAVAHWIESVLTAR